MCICRRMHQGQAQAQAFFHQHSFTMFSRALRPSASVFPVRRVHDNAYMLFSSVCMLSSTGPCARARCTRARSRTVRALLHQGRAHALGPCARTRIWAVLTLAPRPCAHPAPGPCARAQARTRAVRTRSGSHPGRALTSAPGPCAHARSRAVRGTRSLLGRQDNERAPGPWARARSRAVRRRSHPGRAHALAPRPCAHPAPGPCARAQVLAVRSRPHQGRARSLPGARHALAPGPSGPRQSGPAEIAVLDPRTQDPERSC